MQCATCGSKASPGGQYCAACGVALPAVERLSMVFIYTRERTMRKETAKLAHGGWRVASTTTRPGYNGWVRFAWMGLLAAFIKPKPEIVVVYERDGPEAAAPQRLGALWGLEIEAEPAEAKREPSSRHRP
jgi:hypothetical protein